MPPLDQTPTVGLVGLPGAFIGVLLGGGSAAEAGAAQVLVLAAMLAGETFAVAVVLELVVRPRLLPDARTLVPARPRPRATRRATEACPRSPIEPGSG